MRWKQFFTPVDSIDAFQAHELINSRPPGEIGIIDVRQPAEYARGHIPGARLIPLPELSERLKELKPGDPTLVY